MLINCHSDTKSIKPNSKDDTINKGFERKKKGWEGRETENLPCELRGSATAKRFPSSHQHK